MDSKCPKATTNYNQNKLIIKEINNDTKTYRKLGKLCHKSLDKHGPYTVCNTQCNTQLQICTIVLFM